MRYTTIIDISDIPAIYRNHNVRLIYLHLALKAGYHDEDRDITDLSVRRLSADSGLTISATRHALKILEASKMITRTGNAWLVKKWILEGTITKREKSSQAARQKEIRTQDQALRREQEEREASERRQRRQMQAAGRTPFMAYYEDLERKAQDGDLEAAALVQKHRATYEQHLAQIKAKSQEK